MKTTVGIGDSSGPAATRQMAHTAMKYCLLGPNPANQSYSISKYVRFYREYLPALLGCQVNALSPGGHHDGTDILPSRSGVERLWQNYVLWPTELSRLKSDCFHIADHGLLWYARFLRGGRRLATVHDLIAFMNSTEGLGLPRPRSSQRFFIRESSRQLLKVDHIVSVSQFTADCLVREFGIPARRITVIPNHLDGRFWPVPEEERTQARARWFDNAEYAVLHVGKPFVYKNRLGAIKAFSILRKRLPEARLFLVNGACAREERAFITSEDCAGSITFIPPVDTASLREIYNAADVLLFPSFYEGFGWPPVEAMACGCPVVTSTRGSLPEVVGDAALKVDDPNAHELMADLLFEILSSPETAGDLRRRGLARAKLFSPQKALNAIADVYRMLA